MIHQFIHVILALAVLLGISPLASAQTTWYVDCAAIPGGDGSSGNPFDTIQAGLNACIAGDQVEVADGTCTENLAWPATDGIRLYSASGNPASCVIDGGTTDTVITVGDPPSLTIEGFRIQNGGGSDYSYLSGPGILIVPATDISATIDNVEVQNNQSGIIAMGGYYGYGTVNLTVTNSTIRNNLTLGGFYSAGILCYGTSGTLTVTGCTITENNFAGILTFGYGLTTLIADNKIFANAGPLYGGYAYGFGILIQDYYQAGHLDILNNEIYHNYDDPSTNMYSMGIYILGASTGTIVKNTVYDHLSETGVASGVLTMLQECLIDKNVIFNNVGSDYYGGYISSGGLLLNLGGYSAGGTYTVTNNIISSNGPDGIQAVTGETGGQILLTNNTVTDNLVAGIRELAYGASEVVVTNCIVGDWNSSTGATDLVPTVGSEFTVSYSDIQDQLPARTDGGNNISLFPNFVDANGVDDIFGTMDDDYHITGVPCQNSGSGLAPGLPSDDIDDEPRFLNPDIGADEVITCTSIGDCNDGLFCNGEETCVEGYCQAGTDPCLPGENCNEGTNACGPCTGDADCTDGVFCNGLETCDAVNDCQPGTDPCDDGIGCTDDSCDEVEDVCANDPDDGNCDDGYFCTGVETCDAVNDCQAGTPIDCPEGQICDEDSEQCVLEPCTVRILPPSATLFTWESLQFSTTLDGGCNEPCFTWEISVQESTGSTINQNGLYTAGGNRGTDIIRVSDPCNGNISDNAIVNVRVPCIPDIYEPDDILPAANPIELNSCRQFPSICPIGDHDWLTFELTSESGVFLGAVGPEGDTVICLYDNDGNVIACDDNSGPGLFSFIEQPCLPAGTYYIEIWGYGEVPEYQICVTLNPCPTPVELDCNKLLASSQFGELFRIDLTDGSAEFIGPMPDFLATEIEYDNLSQTLYAEEVDGFENLHSIDPETGISLGFVTHEYDSLNGLEFVGATLYGTFKSGGGGPPSELVIVDTSTGNLTHIGPTGYGPISGLAYDEGAEVMYGITAGGVPADLVTINLSTGAATVVGPTGLDRIGSIEFGPDGNLYGGVTAFGSSFATYLIRIDTTTGAVTPIGETGYSITGLTACEAGDGCIVHCRKAESGSLNIVETAGRSGSQVPVTVEINSAPNPVNAIGFDVLYDPTCLEYTGEWQPRSCVANWGISSVGVTNPAPGVVRFGGFTTIDPVQQGESCNVVELTFTVVTPALDSPNEAIRLDLQTLVDDVAGWSDSPGFICGGCSCDINGNEIITPQDALCAFQKYLGICPTDCGPCEEICGDVNGDGSTTPADALCIFQEYLGIDCDHCN